MTEAEKIRRQGWQLRALSAALIAASLVLAAALYTQLIQRRPQIITVSLPVANANADATGASFQVWSKRANSVAALMDRRAHDAEWRPVPVGRFSPGQTVWVRRQSCYVDKAAVQGVRVELIGTGAAAGRRFAYPPADPPKRTVPEPPALAQRSYGPVGELGHCAAFNYPYALPDMKARDADGVRPLWEPLPSTWILRTSVRFVWTWFLPSVPAWHPDVYVDVTAPS